ncbi:hypothetical protein ACFWVM_25425 [Nocardia fluminea]|nr:hypothetical protein [Nocardia fluminea]
MPDMSDPGGQPGVTGPVPGSDVSPSQPATPKAPPPETDQPGVVPQR